MERLELEAGTWAAVLQVLERTTIQAPAPQVAQFWAAVTAAKVITENDGQMGTHGLGRKGAVEDTSS